MIKQHHQIETRWKDMDGMEESITHKSVTACYVGIEWRPTWKCSCPGTALWGNSGRNMVMKAGRLHSALSFSGPTPANLRTCSGMSGGLPWSIRRCPRRRAGGARRQRPAGIDRPTLERNPRHPDEQCSLSCPAVSLCQGERGQRWPRLSKESQIGGDLCQVNSDHDIPHKC